MIYACHLISLSPVSLVDNTRQINVIAPTGKLGKLNDIYKAPCTVLSRYMVDAQAYSKSNDLIKSPGITEHFLLCL